MKPVLLSFLLFALANSASGHRLDEYLQAGRISVATNRIELSLDLTPGVAVAEQVLAVIDKDRDGRISQPEAGAYAQRVLNDLRIELDEKVLTLTVAETSFPTTLEMTAGVGVIRITATAPIMGLSAGSHALHLANAHLPKISVYLVNALAPKDPALKIARQIRDELQRDYKLEFGVMPTSPP